MFVIEQLIPRAGWIILERFEFYETARLYLRHLDSAFQVRLRRE